MGILSVAIVVLVPLCASGRIPRNPYIGIRMPAFFISDETWRAGHRAAVLPCICGAVVGIIASVLVIAVPTLANVWFAVATGGVLVGVIIGAVVGIRAAESVAS